MKAIAQPLDSIPPAKIDTVVPVPSVGLTIEHVNALLIKKAQYESCILQREVYKSLLDSSFVEIDTRNEIIKNQGHTISVMDQKNDALVEHNDLLSGTINGLQKSLIDARKSKNWIIAGGSTVIGILLTLLLIN